MCNRNGAGLGTRLLSSTLNVTHVRKDTTLSRVLIWEGLRKRLPKLINGPNRLSSPPLPPYQARDLAAADAGGYDPTAHEDEPTDLTVGITIENLTKIYGASWVIN